MGGFIDKRPKNETENENDLRHPLQMNEIEPVIQGKRAEWSDDIDEIAIYISGSKTDWLSQGMVRSHHKIPENTNNHHLCSLRSLVNLREVRPAKFQKIPIVFLPLGKVVSP